MALTVAQLQALKAAIAANVATIPAGQQWTNTFTGVAVNAIPNTNDGNSTIAGWYNQLASPSFFGNYATVPANDILNAISWKKLTPVDAIPTTPQLDVMVWLARSNACQGFQFNLQNIMMGRSLIDATKGKIRTGLQDSLSTVPSDTSGTAQDAGWAAVQKILCRVGTNAEKVLADTSGGAGDSNTTAATFTFEGKLIGDNIEQARAS